MSNAYCFVVPVGDVLEVRGQPGAAGGAGTTLEVPRTMPVWAAGGAKDLEGTTRRSPDDYKDEYTFSLRLYMLLGPISLWLSTALVR